ncbi:hypothetical protein NLI96_g6573 [Meripilus lineatus]|uniref:Survival protein SurE-like phosphatase/nucleotidase domain-containing protein n=1 Tax=Meripilus lineatus TaxID=2056292 RepID=A0AAD5V5J6_9APHY|nr:hypothetical protein NLI96_g6573 [Physisporinus lineatus]
MLTRLQVILSFILLTSAQKILVTNDDGWAVAQIRAQFNALESAGYDVCRTGSSSAPPTTLTTPCEFNTCPTGSPPEGADANDPRLNYVNSFPVDSVRFGIQTLSPQLFGSRPDFIVSGPNVGNNLGTGVRGSGTVGAACEAALENLPSIAFSGASTSHVSFTTLQTDPTSSATVAALLYSQLTVQLVNALLRTTLTPTLPSGITLNVNYPRTSLRGCTSISNYAFVFTRLVVDNSATDVETCGSTRLPDESTVVGAGCFASVTVINATTKMDVSATVQGQVLSRFPSTFFSCFSN